MSISFRTFALVATAVLSAAVLSGCGDDVEHDVKATASPTVTTVPDKEGTDAAKFVKDFRKEYPTLAKGREDQDLVTDGDDTCNLFEDDDANRADVIGEVSETFEANGIKPNDKTAINIMTLAVKDLCTYRTTNLNKALN